MFTDSHLLAVIESAPWREAILRAFNQGDDAEAAFLIRDFMKRRASATTPALPPAVVKTPNGQGGRGEGLSEEAMTLLRQAGIV
jgi:hypothetical protein